MSMVFVCLYGEGRPRLDLEYPIYGAHELADEGVFTSATYPSLLPKIRIYMEGFNSFFDPLPWRFAKGAGSNFPALSITVPNWLIN